MEEKITGRMDDKELTPAEYAALMLENTDEKGLLRIPEENFTDGLTEFDENGRRVFEMDWNAEKLSGLIEDFEELFGNIKEIAEACAAVGADPLHDSEIAALGEGRLADVWRKYIRGYEFGELSREAVDAIGKLPAAERGEEELTVEEKELCDRYCDDYIESEKKEAAKRLGGGIFDTEVIWRARRVCRLMMLYAPGFVIQNEARRLVEVMALTRYAKREILG